MIGAVTLAALMGLASVLAGVAVGWYARGRAVSSSGPR